MFFGEKPIVGPEKCFAFTDLLEYVEKLLKEAEQRSKKFEVGSNYHWLKAKGSSELSLQPFLDELRPLICKMLSESCVAVAVKLDRMTEGRNFSTGDLQIIIKQLLLEQDSMRLIDKSVKGAKETKNGGKINKVHPELNGRQAIVCFIVENDFL